MEAQRRMYVGTHARLEVLREEDGGWRTERTALDGKSINTLVASPDAGAVFAAATGEGVYVSNDGGATWDLAFEGDVRTIAFDPRQPWALYAGTEPARLFRSDDAGDSWQEVEGLQRLPEEVRDRWWFPQPPHQGHVLSICVDPRNSQVIYLGIEHGGIFRTEDGGEHWEDLSAGIEYIDIHVVAADPVRENLCYAATARGFYRSEDHGRTWVLAEAGMDRDYFHDMAVRPGRESTLFVATANGIPPTWLRDGKAQAAIYRSTDAGLTWRQVGDGLPPSLETMVWGLVGDPVADARVYAGTGEYPPNLAPGETGIGEVWESDDRGDRWRLIHRTPSPVRALCVAAG